MGLIPCYRTAQRCTGAFIVHHLEQNKAFPPSHWLRRCSSLTCMLCAFVGRRMQRPLSLSTGELGTQGLQSPIKRGADSESISQYNPTIHHPSLLERLSCRTPPPLQWSTIPLSPQLWPRTTQTCYKSTGTSIFFTHPRCFHSPTARALLQPPAPRRVPVRPPRISLPRNHPKRLGRISVPPVISLDPRTLGSYSGPLASVNSPTDEESRCSRVISAR